MCYSLWYNAPTMLPAGGGPATSWVHYTTSCNTQSSTPEDGQNNCSKHVELIGIINKPLLLHLVGCILLLFISNNVTLFLFIYCKWIPKEKSNALMNRSWMHWSSLPPIQCCCMNSAKIFGDAIQTHRLHSSYLYFSDGKFPACLFVIRMGIFRSRCGLRGADIAN